MYFLLDVLIIAIYVLVIWYFKNKGFLRASETIVSIIITFTLMPVFAQPFGEFIDNSAFGKGIHQKVERAILENGNKSEVVLLPDVFKENIEAAEGVKDTVVKNTANQITSVIIKVLSFILLYIIAKIAIFVIFKILILICKIRILGFFDRLLGMIFGFLDATIIIYLVCALAFIFMPAEIMAEVKQGISGTILTDYFYNENLLINIFL